eukprot:1015280-Prymnesium_polylepis.1
MGSVGDGAACRANAARRGVSRRPLWLAGHCGWRAIVAGRPLWLAGHCGVAGAAGCGKRTGPARGTHALLRDALAVRRVAAVGARAQRAVGARVAGLACARAVEANAVLCAVGGAAAQRAIESTPAFGALALEVDALAAPVARVGAARLVTLRPQPPTMAEALRGAAWGER